MSIINVCSPWHLGDNIINFIFFYKIKNYIEENNITINYFCHSKYHKNLLDFKCSENIKINDYNEIGYLLWQGTYLYLKNDSNKMLCTMFNDFLIKSNIPISVDSFEYKDVDLFTRFENLNEIYKNIDILIINSTPLSGQYFYNKNEWDKFIIELNKKYKVAVSEYINDDILSLDSLSVKNIAALALKVKGIIAINTGPSIPLYNTDILDNVDFIYIFGKENDYNMNFRKVVNKTNINDLSFLLENK